MEAVISYAMTLPKQPPTLFSRFCISLLDVVFPKKCFSCQSEGEWLCPRCEKNLPRRIEQVCPICEKRITPIGSVCLICRPETSLDGMLVVSEYSNPLTKKIIHHFKYRFIQDLASVLATIVCEEIERTEFPLPDMIVAVPLHPRRLRWRGFNQSQLVADTVSKRLVSGFTIPVSRENLARVKSTTSQMKIHSAKQRKANVASAFRVARSEEFTGKKILLIDDVATSGATLESCAKQLKSAGAKSVFALVIARQSWSQKNTIRSSQHVPLER